MGTNENSVDSCFRSIHRRIWIPHTASDDGLKRSWERGISISAVQPSESIVVWTFQTGSQEKSAFPLESM